MAGDFGTVIESTISVLVYPPKSPNICRLPQVELPTFRKPWRGMADTYDITVSHPTIYGMFCIEQLRMFLDNPHVM